MAPFQQKRMLAHLRPPGDDPQPKGPGGRRSTYDPSYCDLIIEKMREGISLTGFAGVIGVSRDTIYQWMTLHREFADAVTRGRAARDLWWELKLMRSRKGAEVTASIFALKNCAPDEWRDVKYQQHSHLHEIKQLTDDQLHRIAAGHSGDLGDNVIEGECVRQANER